MADISEEAYAEARSLYHSLLTPGDEACDANVPADIETLARALMARNERIAALVEQVEALEAQVRVYGRQEAAVLANLAAFNEELKRVADIAEAKFGK